MKIIFLAAGLGQRLRPITNDRPKAMVEFNKKPIIAHNIETARKCGISDIVVVGGYRQDTLPTKGVQLFTNERFDKTNMATSLFCAADAFKGDVIVSYTDILYHSSILEKLMQCTADACITIDKNWLELWSARMPNPLEDAETLKLDANGNIAEIGGKPKTLSDVEGQYMGLLKFSEKKIRELYAFYEAQPDRESISITPLLARWIKTGTAIKAVPISGGWFEVDTLDDLKKFEGDSRWNRLPESF